MTINVNVEYVATFHSIEEWRAKAQRELGHFEQQDQIICLDEEGNACNIGSDFKYAKYPVIAYRLIRTTEVNAIPHAR